MPAPITFDVLKTRVLSLRKEKLGATGLDRKADWDELFDRALLDPCIAGFAYFDNNFILRKTNGIYAKFLREYTEYDIDHAVGMTYFDLAPGSTERAGLWLKYVMDSRSSKTRYNLKVRFGQGRRSVVSYWNQHVSPVIDDQGDVAGTVICYVDITDRVVSRKSEESRDLLGADDNVYNMRAHLLAVSRQLDRYKFEWQNKFVVNIKNTIFPRIDYLKHTPLDREQRACIRDIEYFLENIIPPHIGAQSDAQLLAFEQKHSKVVNLREREESTPDVSQLTPMEAKVAQLVGKGRSSKEIAFILGVSKRGVDFHRNNIRKKLNLSQRKVNLAGYLRSLQG